MLEGEVPLFLSVVSSLAHWVLFWVLVFLWPLLRLVFGDLNNLSLFLCFGLFLYVG